MIHLPDITGELWFNSKPLEKEDLKNKVVLVDFWTYSCVNCRRTLPYLQDWWEKYKDKEFLLIGIHTPEFEFEKEAKNVEQAIKELGVTWPIVVDNEYKNWNAFANHYWPAKYLADKSGNIVYTHFGEGDYTDTEREIQRLLKQNHSGRILPSIYKDEHEHGKVCFIATAETYCGYKRGKLAGQEYDKDRESYYNATSNLPLNSIALNGKFYADSEFVESREQEAELLLHFTATEVNVVLSSPNKERSIIAVQFNNQVPEADIKGHDLNEAGEVVIAKSSMYNIIKSNDLLDGVLKIRAEENNFRAFVFTFSGCQE